jgi:tetratricopeptide (TPR) repeat protein
MIEGAKRMKKFLIVMLLVVAATGFVQQASSQAAAPATQKKEIKDPAEYNAYVNAIQQQDPNAKAQALEAFIQTYPNSVMKIDAAEQLMAAYQQAGNAQKMIDAANRILQMDPNNVRALAILTYTYRATITAQNLQQNLPLIQKYATQGEQALSSMPKPEGTSDADFTKLHNELGAIFEGGLGFVALQNKTYADASTDFRKAVAEESQANIADIYPLAQADLEAKPMNPEGFWFIIKAANLAQGDGKAQILDYGRKKYIRYHGSEQGWQELVTDATSNSSVVPPSGFTVAPAPPPPSPAEQAADLVKSKDPKKMSFAEWQLVLSSGNQTAADTVWNTIKDKAVKLGASVISASASSLQLAGSEDDIDAKKADITVGMAKPLPAKLVPQAGAQIFFQGTVSSYTPNPFMMTFTDGVLLDKNGNPVSTAAPAHHTTTHKKQ